jgi:COMPASS component SWD3
MNFDNAEVTFVVTACLAGGIAAIYSTYRQLVAANRIKDTPTSKISELTDGFREIKGRIVKGDKKLHSPMSGKQCVYYAFTVTESNDDSSKEIISEKKSTRCYLDDGTGTAAIELDGAELVLDIDHHDKSGTFNSASPELEKILKRYGKSSKGLLFNKELKYEETILEAGDELYVLGPAQMVKGSICFKTDGGQSLIVSDKSERELLQKHDSKSLLSALAGVVLFVIAGACLANPDSAAELLARSNGAADSGAPRNENTFDDSIRDSQRIIEESKQSMVELNQRVEKIKEEGKAYELRQQQRQKESEKATANLKKKYDTQHAHYNRGNALRVQGKMDEAIDAYRKAIELNPNYAGAHYNLGNALRDQEKPDEAIDAYKKAIELNPNYAEAHCNLGHVLKRQRRFTEALRYLERGHELGSKNSQWKYPSARWVEDVKRQADLPSLNRKELVSGAEVLTLSGHTGSVRNISISPDGKRIASCSDDKSAKIWDSETGQELLTLKGHTERVISVNFSPDGKRVVTGSADNTAMIWDAETGKETHRLRGNSSWIVSAVFSPDAKQVATGGWDKTVKIWDVTSGNVLRTLRGHTECVTNVDFSPDGKSVVSCGMDETVKVWNAETGEEIRTLLGHSGRVETVAFGPFGKRIASGGTDRTIRIWSVDTGQEVRSLEGNKGIVFDVRFSADGQRIVNAAWDSTVRIWNIETGKEIATLEGHANEVWSAAFTPDEKRIVSCSRDKTIKIWNIEKASSASSDHQPAVTSAVSADGSRDSITYQPFLANVWRAKNQSTQLFLWEGEQVVFLTTTDDLDPKTMAVFVKRLDAAWKRCGELVGQSPYLIRPYKRKVTITAVPDASFTINTGTGFGFGPHGMGAIEVAGFYGPQGDYERVRKDPDSFPDYYFLLIGQNHSVPMDRLNMARNGSALLLRQLCSDEFKPTPSEAQAQKAVERFENSFAQSTATFAEAFPRFGAKKPVPIKDIDGKVLAASDLNLLFASCLLKVRQDNGGDAYINRFYRHLSECPPVAWRQYKLSDIAKGQVVNWVVAASLAAGKDLTPLFRDRWRFPLEPEVWNAFKSVDWEKPGLANGDVFEDLPFAQLPREIAVHLPAFLTPERRKQNLIIGGTFEDGSGGTWKGTSWRSNKAAVAVVSNEAKQGRNSVAVRSPRVRDHVRYEQKVSVKPNTRYFVSGWIKTKDVVVVEEGGQLGANISIGGVSSRSFEGTNDWRYATLIFDSRQLNEVTVSAHLGYRASTAKGEAWFDDLCMIPLSPGVVRMTPPVAVTPSANKAN